MQRSRRRLPAAALLVLAAAACSATPSVEDDRVLVVGDSLVNGTASAITQGLTNEGWQPVVDGRPGWSIGRWASGLAPVADLARARVAVVVLGTNDCAPECRDVDQGITRILHTLTEAGVERVLWLNVQEDADYPDHPDEVNGRLALAAARWPQLSIVDLSSALGGRPELHSDRVHFNEAGGLALTELVLDQLDRTR